MKTAALAILIALIGLYFEDRNIAELRKASAAWMPDTKP